ncbi:unnamed protein product [Eruca vesicaria subsp. sativa]|uniref:Uncharacterized protein n=1 Tax=Eruca vesicaria subsp. sativa TaxID=29727 RepID=A0ABC8M855_ERUVS|nr:unnamed protein product [Eruca vesicaria subsp. sativa]
MKFSGEFDTQPGRRHVTCAKFKNDGFHFRHPWVFAKEDEVKRLMSCVDRMVAQIVDIKDQVQRIGTRT